MSRRLYLGSRSLFDSCSTSSDIGYLTGLPADTRSEDVSKLFDGYGRIIDCRVMTGSSNSVVRGPCYLPLQNRLWFCRV